jgi:hypothetical protein
MWPHTTYAPNYDIHLFLFGVFWGDVRHVNSCNVILLLFIALLVPISATLFRRAMLTVWHAFVFLGHRFFTLFFFLLGGLQCFFSCKKLYWNM